MSVQVNDNTIRMVQGDYLKIAFDTTDAGGDAYDFQDGDRIYFLLAPKGRTLAVVEAEIPTETGLIVIDSEQSAKLASGEYWWQVRVNFADGREETYAEGRLIVDRGISP